MQHVKARLKNLKEEVQKETKLENRRNWTEEERREAINLELRNIVEAGQKRAEQNKGMDQRNDESR